VLNFFFTAEEIEQEKWGHLYPNLNFKQKEEEEEEERIYPR